MSPTDTIYDYTTVDDIPVVAGSACPLVMPRPGQPVVAVPVATGTILNQADVWWDGNVTTSGTYIMGSEPGDVYPNDETLDFYELSNESVEEYEAIAAAIVAIVGDAATGPAQVMSKTRGVELLGYASEGGKLRTAEGPVEFAKGDAIVRSPDRSDRVWRIVRATFDKKYDV